MFCKQKILCIRRDVLYTSKISKILVILTPKPLRNEGFYYAKYVKYVRIWKAIFSVGVVNRVNSAPVDILESAYLLPHQLLLPLLYWKLLAFRTVSKTHCSSRSDIGGGT